MGTFEIWGYVRLQPITLKDLKGLIKKNVKVDHPVLRGVSYEVRYGHVVCRATRGGILK